MKIYKRKPQAFEAVQWTGKNKEEIKAFCPTAIFNHFRIESYPDLTIPKLDGNCSVAIGDFIIKDINGECSSCPERTFYELYEEVK